LLKELLTTHGEHWAHIKEFLLKDYIWNSVILVVFVGLIVAIIGTYLSWNLSHYNHKHNGLKFALLFIPMAIPPYIGGYIYGGIFSYGGTLERLFRTFDIKPVHIDMLSMSGAIFVFSLFLMPYVVLITKSFFHKLPASYLESSRLLGQTSGQTFRKIILPLSRGAIIGGTVLVILEVLNDYGLVQYFGITTFSTAIYKTWFGLGDISSAIRLASILMIFVFVILSGEQLLRGRMQISQPRALAKSDQKKEPSKIQKTIFTFIFGTYIFFSVIVPIGQLIHWSIIASKKVAFRGMFTVIKDTIVLAIIVTIFVILCGLIIGNFNRLKKSVTSKIYSRIIILGYSIPASIIAVAVLTFFISFDRFLKPIYQIFELKNLFLTSSLTMLMFALIIRFMAIGFNGIESGFKKMGSKYYEASKLLGKGEIKTFFNVDLPLLKPAIISASILTFVDVLKELPLTLILRPFNYNTLATQVYTYAGDEMIHEASIYALIIIAISASALVILQLIQKEKKNDTSQ
jgi:iron(III) transport system permease protein